MKTITKIGLGILGVFAVTSIYATKKVKDLIDISQNLKFRLASIPHNVNWKQKTVLVDLYIKNPTQYYLNAKNFSINNLKLTLENNTIAQTQTTIGNFEIPPNSEIRIDNIEVRVTVTLLDLYNIIKNYKKIKITADINAFGHNVYTVNT